MSYSGQPTVCSQNKCESFISSCEREPETINSRTDYGVKHSVALCCYFKVRFTLLLIKANLALNDMYDIMSNLNQNLLSHHSLLLWGKMGNAVTALDIHLKYSIKLSLGVFPSTVQLMFQKAQLKL